jgi:hypothetical protein
VALFTNPSESHKVACVESIADFRQGGFQAQHSLSKADQFGAVAKTELRQQSSGLSKGREFVIKFLEACCTLAGR